MAGDSTLYFTVRKGATALPNRVALNRELSIQARGVLLVLCARPQGAPMGYRALMGQGMGETALRSALRELEAAGHRWRFRLRRAGVVRTAVAVFDEPATFEEALASVREHAPEGFSVEKCLSVPDEESGVEPAVVDRAVDFQARCESPTVPCSTEARSTAARSAKAQLLRSSKDSSLRSESPPSNPPRDAAGEGRGESSAPKPEVSSTRPTSGRISDADRGLVRECLPESMRDLPDSGIRQIVPELRLRVERGWTPEELRRVLAAQALPPTVLSMPHLVLHRLRDIDPDGSGAARAARRQQQLSQHLQQSPEADVDVEASIAALRDRNPQLANRLAERLARYVSHGEAHP